jgi:hypothetical protein
MPNFPRLSQKVLRRLDVLVGTSSSSLVLVLVLVVGADAGAFLPGNKFDSTENAASA